MKNFIPLILSLFVSSFINAQCPEEADITRNDKCIKMVWDVAPNPFPTVIDDTGTSFIYHSGAGTAGDPAIFLTAGSPINSCNATDNGYTGNLNIGGETCTFVDGMIVLPVELISFSGEFIGPGIVGLQWSTATETNNDKFVVERKLGNQSWDVIAEISGAGNTTISQRYSFDDVLGQNIPIAYYRLKQVDFDGAYDYSNVVVLRTKIDKNSIYVVGDGHGRTVLNIETQEVKKLNEIRLYNMFGQAVQSIEVQETINGFYQKTLNLDGLAAGTYIVTTIFGDGSMTSKAVRFSR